MELYAYPIDSVLSGKSEKGILVVPRVELEWHLWANLSALLTDDSTSIWLKRGGTEDLPLFNTLFQRRHEDQTRERLCGTSICKWTMTCPIWEHVCSYYEQTQRYLLWSKLSRWYTRKKLFPWGIAAVHASGNQEETLRECTKVSTTTFTQQETSEIKFSVGTLKI